MLPRVKNFLVESATPKTVEIDGITHFIATERKEQPIKLVPPVKRSAKTVLILSRLYSSVLDLLPVDKQKYGRLHELLTLFGLGNSRPADGFFVQNALQASDEDLCKFHSEEYVQILKLCTNILQMPNGEVELSKPKLHKILREYGLVDDCPPFRGLMNYVRLVAGSTLQAADYLKRGADVAINFGGGRHHGRRSAAKGFCYVNDIILGIESLQSHFKRVLYIDLDIHHGDGVQDYYYETDSVFTLSIHHYEHGFFPCTGDMREIGKDSGRWNNMNICFKEGLSDDIWTGVVYHAFPRIVAQFRPDAIVVCCGGDVLANDPKGVWNITTGGYLDVIKLILRGNIPTMFLGGGGYDPVNTGLLWLQIVAEAAQIKIPAKIPEHDDFMDYKHTGFTIHTDENPYCIDANKGAMGAIIMKWLKAFQCQRRLIDVSVQKQLDMEITGRKRKRETPSKNLDMEIPGRKRNRETPSKTNENVNEEIKPEFVTPSNENLKEETNRQEFETPPVVLQNEPQKTISSTVRVNNVRYRLQNRRGKVNRRKKSNHKRFKSETEQDVDDFLFSQCA